MSQFDPYHKWLGIPAKDQPPNLYRLLGVELLESDFDVIENAADQRTRHVRSFQMGAHQEESQRLLNEISQAKVVLLDPQRKAAYDQQLAAKVDTPPPTADYDLQPDEQAPETPTITDIRPTSTAAVARGHRKRAKGGPAELVKIVLGGLAGTALAFVLLGFLREDWDKLGIARSVRAGLSKPDPSPLEPVAPPPQDPSPAAVPPPVTPPPVKPPVVKPEVKPPVVKPTTPTPPKAALIDVAPQRGLPPARGTPTFTYVRGENNTGPKTMGPSSKSFVVSSLLAGHFLGNGEWYDIKVVDVKGVPHWQFRTGGVKAIAAATTEIQSPLRAWFEDQVEFKEWKRGEQPIQLIHKNDGFALLSGVSGCLLGPEEAQVTLNNDGFWYVSGKTVHDTRARATIYRFKLPGKFRATVKEQVLKPRDKITGPRFDEALCSLSRVTGTFVGFGEALHCAIDEQGRWDFHCDALQASTSGTVTSIVFDVRAMIELAERTEPEPNPMPMQKLAVPSASELTTAQARLAADIEGKSAAELRALAAKAEPGDRYALLIAARDQAADAGECDAALASVDDLVANFTVDRFDLTRETLQKLRAGCETPAANRQLATLALTQFEQGKALNKPAALRPLLELALAAARAAKDTELQGRATLKLLELPK
jgi:hypothetical protein